MLVDEKFAKDYIFNKNLRVSIREDNYSNLFISSTKIQFGKPRLRKNRERFCKHQSFNFFQFLFYRKVV